MQKQAEKYVQANLDLTFQGQTQEAKEILGASDSDLKKVYENGINAFVQDCLLNGVETENDFSETYGVLIKEIFIRKWPSAAFYFVGSIMENSEPLPGSETTLI